MIVHLIRHAHAGSRSRWEGDDRSRPLSGRGRHEADAIAADLADAGIDLLWASPYLRCIQTLDPLAARLGLTVAPDDRLAEGASGGTALGALLGAAADGRTVAACSHGDVIPALIAQALGAGATLEGPASPAKAARYLLHVADGQVTRIEHVPAPA